MKLSQLLFWILETQDFPTNVHLEPNLGMMGVQKKKNVYICGPGLQITGVSSPKPTGFLYQNSAHTNAWAPAKQSPGYRY